MFTPKYFPPDHYQPDQPVIYWEVTFSSAHREDVVLTASIADGQGTPLTSPTLGQTATTLEVRMDRQVAIQLHAKLTELGHSMGWLPETKA